MTSQVQRLETLGLVDRTADPRDGRAVLLSATRTGAARHRRTKHTARALYEKLLADWSDDDLHLERCTCPDEIRSFASARHAAL